MAKKTDLNRIKVMLVEKNKTSKWLSEKLDKALATISKWCTNSSQLMLDVLCEIAELLEIDVRELIRVPERR